MKPTKRPNSASLPEPPATDALLSSLTALLSESQTVDGLTTGEIMRATGWCDDTVRKALNRARDAGRLAVQRVRRPALDGVLRPVPVYQIKG